MTAEDKIKQAFQDRDWNEIKTHDSWVVFKVIAEMVEGFEKLAKIGPCVSIFGSARTAPDNPIYKMTEDIAAKLVRHGYGVITGGGPGIMEAANRGAHNVGGKSVGLGISLPFEQGVNDYIPDHLKFEFHYFFVRKYWFILLAKALIAFPGGFGTMDEHFETLTLVQTKSINNVPPIVLFRREFWNDVLNLDALVKWGVVSPEDLDLIKIVDTVEEAHDYVVEKLTERFLSKSTLEPDAL